MDVRGIKGVANKTVPARRIHTLEDLDDHAGIPPDDVNDEDREDEAATGIGD